MYTLECCDSTYYNSSTNNLYKRLNEHQNGHSSNFNKGRLPIKLVYFEKYNRIDKAFYREKQIQDWSKKKKSALINQDYKLLHELAGCQNKSHFKNLQIGR